MDAVTTSQDLRTFCYQGFDLDRAGTRLSCHYALGGRRFVERFELDVPAPARAGVVAARDVVAAARLVHLLAGVSYYKTSAPPVVDLGEASSEAERNFLHRFYLEGLGEFAYRNGLDLSGLEIRSAPADPPGDRAGIGGGAGRARPRPDTHDESRDRSCPLGAVSTRSSPPRRYGVGRRTPPSWSWPTEGVASPP